MEVAKDQSELVAVELKYCERCGELWLRRVGEEEVYCAPCIPKLMELPAVCKLRRVTALPIAEDLQVEGRIEQLGHDDSSSDCEQCCGGSGCPLVLG